MIYKNGKEISQLVINGKILSAVYVGTRLVWQAIRSCFGSGGWINDKPWLNDEGWRN